MTRTSDIRLNQRPVECAFDERVEQATSQRLITATPSTFQVNVGLKCNLACHHCHVESSPKRTEEMTWETMALILKKMKLAGATTLDITGGAPEMNPHFRKFITQATQNEYHIIVRTNLTILLDDGYQDLPAFFKKHQVHLIASLPCYLSENVNKQRGLRVYENSVEAIKRLNKQGYGKFDELKLDLVYNPLGAALPPAQIELERDYRKALSDEYGIHFSQLIAITNMPIGRFLHDLKREGQSDAYMDLLRNAFNPETIEGLMCRHQIHISWDGSLHDCDFNYALNIKCEDGSANHIQNFMNAPNDGHTGLSEGRLIATADHCFGCTAGAGSSCGGAIA